MFIQILIRFLKEKRLFKLIHKYSSIDTINKIGSHTLIMSDDELTLETLFPTNFALLNIFFTENGKIIENEFNQLLFAYTSNVIKDFIKHEDLDDIINYELNDNSYKCLISSSIEDYLIEFEKNNFHPCNFFSYMFSWFQSSNGYGFWHKINYKYRLELCKLLFPMKYTIKKQ